jgi:energy-coupling factor transport system permease protein
VHPAVRILCWLLLAIAVPFLAPSMLVAVSAALVLLTPWAGTELLKLIGRAKWLFVSVFLLYAWSTPGDPVPWMHAAIAPTREGLVAGGMHLWRLLLILTASGLLIIRTPPEDLISGLRILLRFLGRVGVDADRMAARIWLTLKLAAQQKRGPGTVIGQLWSAPQDVPTTLNLPARTMAARDYLLLSSFAMLAATAIW